MSARSFLLTRQLGNSAQKLIQFDVAAKNMFFPAPRLLSGFVTDYKFAMRENWDGRGARAVSQTVIDLAERLIGEFGGLEHLVEVAPGRDGGISFIWDDEQGNYIYLDVGPTDTIHIFYEMLGKAKWEGVSVANDPKIIDQLRRAFSCMYPFHQTVLRFAPDPKTAPALCYHKVG